MEATHPAWGQDLPWVTERAVAGTNTGFRCTAPSGRSFSPQDTARLLLASSTPKAIGETWNTRSRQRHGHLPQSSSSIPIYSCISAFFKIRTYFPNNFASVKQGFKELRLLWLPNPPASDLLPHLLHVALEIKACQLSAPPPELHLQPHKEHFVQKNQYLYSHSSDLNGHRHTVEWNKHNKS